MAHSCFIDNNNLPAAKAEHALTIHNGVPTLPERFRHCLVVLRRDGILVEIGIDQLEARRIERLLRIHPEVDHTLIAS